MAAGRQDERTPRSRALDDLGDFADESDPSDDTVIEDNLSNAFDRTVSEGEQRLHRDLPALFATATLAGMEVAMGILALLAVERATGSPLLGGIAFSIGFVALLLGHSELFTESFLLPVTSVVSRRATWLQLLRLWGVTLVGNLAGGWVMTWLIIEGFPQLRGTAIESARFFATAPLSLRSASLALLAGAAITLMTRMQHGSDEMSAKLVAAVAGAFLLAGLRLFHSILDSLLIFAGLHAGSPDYGYGDWASWLGYTVAGNVVGGIGLVTLLRLVRSRQRVEVERTHNAGRSRDG